MIRGARMVRGEGWQEFKGGKDRGKYIHTYITLFDNAG